MATRNACIVVTYTDEQLPSELYTLDRTRTLNSIARHFEALAGGQRSGTVNYLYNQTAASGTITMATSSGTVGAVINGVTVTVTWGTSDTASSVLLAAAINASSNALVRDHVTATSALGVTTITSKIPGPAGNAVTLAATGTNVTASVARLASGTSGGANLFTI